MALLANKVPSNVKQEINKNLGVPKTRTIQVRNLYDINNKDIKIMAYGRFGTGKTYAIKSLLERNLKVFILSTDVGGQGLVTLSNTLRKENKQDLLKNVHYIVLDVYEDVELFLNNPEKVFPGIFDEDIDVLIWEGFSNFQQYHIYEKVQSTIESDTPDNKKVSEGREAGIQFELQDWGKVRNATIKFINKFLMLHNRKTGKIWHKYITCHEKDVTKNNKIVGLAPLLQGAGASLVTAGFDVVIYMTKTVEPSGRKKYNYVTEEKEGIQARVRGYELPLTMEGDFGKLWDEIVSQSNIKIGDTDNSLIYDEYKEEEKN